jgi:PAS domain S-box-containing protein
MKHPAFTLILRTVLFYLLFGSLWVLLSDRILLLFVSGPAQLAVYQTFKGWLFIAVSGALLYFLLQRELGSRRYTEDALQVSEEHLTGIVHSAMDGIISIDSDQRIVLVNPAARQMFGYKEHELLGQPLAMLIPPPMRSFHRQHVDDFARTRNTERSREMLGGLHGLHADGTEFPIEASISQTNVEGRKLYTVILRDISERRQVENAIRESDRQMKALVTSLDDIVFEFDEGGIYLNVWSADESLLVQPKAKMLGRRLIDVLGEENESQFTDAVKRVVSSGQPENIEYPLEVIGGQRWFLARISPIADSQGIYRTASMLIRDITERKRAEEALRKNEELYRKLTENFPNGTVNIYDRDLRMTFVAGGDMKKYNRKPEEFIGRTFQELAPPETYAVAEPHLLAAFEGKSGYYETPYWKDHYYLVNVAPLREADGSINEIMVVTQNMTERKRAEEELRSSRDRLTELSRQLVETRESEARAIGRELHDQIGQMLTAMKITLDLAGQLPAEASAKKIQQAQELTSELLNRVSRLSLELRPPMLDDLGLIPALVWHVSQYQEGTGIQVDFTHSSVEGRRFAPEIETTAYRTVQEALTNAARHAGAHRIRLEVRAGGGWMELRIQDDGTGVDATSALGKNRGLSGMRERARLVGGTFEIESEKGKGAKILIRLPVQEGAA